MRIAVIGLVAAACVAVACAARGGPHGTTASSPADSASSGSSSGRETFAVTRLASTAAQTVYDALNTIESDILTGRGRGAPDVYVNMVKQTSGLDRLKELSLSAVREVTYLRYDKAQSLPDSRSPGGAILVTLR